MPCSGRCCRCMLRQVARSTVAPHCRVPDMRVGYPITLGVECMCGRFDGNNRGRVEQSESEFTEPYPLQDIDNSE